MVEGIMMSQSYSQIWMLACPEVFGPVVIPSPIR